MIEKIIDWSARNKLFVFVGVAFMIAWALWAVHNIPLDAIPDLSDTQVIVYTRWDRPPQLIEDQITYPVMSALLGAPKVKDIRAFSDYGFSYIYVIFEDGTDVYWARSRVLEYLSKVQQQLPAGAKVELGPDATGVGWIYEYALIDESGKHTLDELRTFQDWHLKYALQSVQGVAEVASIGGYVKQYQVTVDPNALRLYRIPLSDVVAAVKKANDETGARLVELSGTEYMLTVKGYVKTKEDIEQAVLRVVNGVPVKIRNVAKVELGPDIRRGAAELNGEGEVAGGIVVMRYGENALDTINRVKQRLSQVQLPDGVRIEAVYDRSEVITRAINTLKKKLLEEMLVVSLVILVFLLHFPSAVIPIITLPIAVLISFIPMRYTGLTSNIMSLGGIAIAVGAMVDAAIVVVENAHKALAKWQEEGRKGDYHAVLLGAIKEVARPSFFSLIVIAVAFLPIFSLEGIEGRLFKPLAFTKNFAMLFAAGLAITLDPAVRMLFTRLDNYSLRPKWLERAVNYLLVGRIHPEEKHPISRFLHKVYGPAVDFVLKRPWKVIAAAAAAFALSLPLFFHLGSEFMPPLNEGSMLYMPTTLPGISINQATDLLKAQDSIIKSFPEVVSVFGKVGRAETSTDPAPLSMMETTIMLKPRDEWRKGLTWDKLISEMDNKLALPGQVNSWTMPIKGRIDMLTTGVRTPVGIKIYGDDLAVVERVGRDVEAVLGQVRGTRSAFAERTSGGYFMNIYLNRDAIARYGLSVRDVDDDISAAIGGAAVTETVEGRERFTVSVRYPRELRNDVEKIKRTYISTPSGTQIALSSIADIKLEAGPGMIRDENGRLTGYVYIDVAGRDLGSYVSEAKAAVRKVSLPPGYSLQFSGQYELIERVKQRMKVVVPLTLFIIFILLYVSTRSYVKTFIILLAVPFSLIGALWMLAALGYNLSIGVWSGIIALLGVDAETGIFMLLYLDLAHDEAKRKGVLKTVDDLKAAVHHGAVRRIRPKLMTAAVLFVGLLPIMWAGTGEIGADVMKRIAAPMVGGIFTSFLMELLVYPAVYFVWKKKELKG